MQRSSALSPVTVRLATINEASAIAAVLREAFIEFRALYSEAAFAATTPTPKRLEQRWREGPVWVAVQDARILGTVAAVARSQGLYVRSLAVQPEVLGRGIGRLLLERVVRFAEAQNYRRLYLSTTPFLAGAIRLYEQFGFVRTEEGPLELHGTPLFTMEMESPLSAEDE